MQLEKKIPPTGTVPRSFKTVRAAMVAALLGGVSLSAGASTVTYTFSGTFSGSIGATTFTDAAAVFTLTGDTSNIQAVDNAFFYNTMGASAFQLGRSAPVTFLSSTFGVESEYGAASFMDTATSFAAGEYNELTPYDALSGSSSTSGMFVSYGSNPERTSGGDLILTGATGDVTFTTQVVAPASAPEPASIWLLTTGLIAEAVRFRSRRRSF